VSECLVDFIKLLDYNKTKLISDGDDMSCIKTYTGVMFDPLNPDPDLIDIMDIAHALSMLCRANGHFRSFYSVGQHSINCMREAKERGYSEKLQLACLLHDASEAYLSDVTRPVKKELPKYLEIEKPLQDAIWAKYLDEPLTQEEHDHVFEIDDAILYHEFVALMDARLSDEEPTLSSMPGFAFTGFEQCEEEFLWLFRRLTHKEKDCFVVGIDWMKPCWLAAEIRDGEVAVRKLTDISHINNYYLNADAVLIDIPVGLPEGIEEDAKRPDREARAYLATGRKPSIFPVPCRQVLGIEDYATASAENERILGIKLTSQSHGFMKMILQVDQFLERNPSWKNRLVESHPEVAFQMLNRGVGLQYSKHTPEGIAERVALLKQYGVVAAPVLTSFKPKQHEDVLDAVCLAVSAKMGIENGFMTIPEVSVPDKKGLYMQMAFGRIEAREER
ncbi:MAG: DUF429 domain-containing protein, partial [Oscillospiraceae bacterium]|nr:DUF429 domain-containing protein [Oscillospiraceae bacterium]